MREELCIDHVCSEQKVLKKSRELYRMYSTLLKIKPSSVSSELYEQK